eukprot:scaffold2709_cov163-Ochromonas_danica.AAC.15
MPPPNVTGYLHMGHAIFLALQDIMVRYHRMTGKPTLWLPGTDHAGIATQLLVEKQLSKEGISRRSLGRDAFVSKVWQWKEDKGGYILNQMRRLGASADWSREKFTLDPLMSEAVTEAFIRLYEKGLIYRGEYMVNWSPALQTAVSDLEVEYFEEQGILYTFKYELADGSGYIPVATTRPETILGDTAVCVHPADERYKHFIGKLIKVPFMNRSIPVIADDYVDMEFGTGALKITPAHDVNDYAIGKRHQLAAINVMNKDGTINELGGQYAGLDRFECRSRLWKDLGMSGLVIKEEKHMQRIPRSQRGGEIVEPLLSSQWFVKMDGMASRAVQAVKTGELRILPERFEKTWFNWLENIHDWCISRQLWWGHRIPVYYVWDKEKMSRNPDFIVARSLEEARRMAIAKFGEEIVIEQDEDVLDTWFSSGLWPFATVGWPHDEHKTDSDLHRFYPASVLETGYDILFFWVARMVTMGLELTNKVPFHTIYLHGLVRDGEGQKMSKTKGNVIDPLDTIDQYGCDALRFSLVTGSTPGQDVPLSLEKVEANRNFINKLWNVGKFIQVAVQNDSISPDDQVLLSSHLPIPERYIVSRCKQTILEATEHLEQLRIGEAGKLLYDFLWDEFADWYVEVAKLRLRSTKPETRAQAQQVLIYVWKTSLQLLHPFAPFVTEVLWQLVHPQEESIMVSPWPRSRREEVDVEAVESFQRIQLLVRTIRNIRTEYKVDLGKKVKLLIRASDSVVENLRSEAPLIALLSRCDEEIKFISDKEAINRDPNVVHAVVDNCLDIFLPLSSLVDKEKESQRLTKQIEKIHKDLVVLEGRLGSVSFRSKAPVHLVEEVEKKAQDFRAQIVTLQDSLTKLNA